MKRLLVAILSLMLLASCGEERLGSSDTKDYTIKFGLTSANRSLVNSADDILGMRVSAQMNLAKNSTEYVTLLENELVERENIGSDWEYENTRYWIEDRVFHFFAVHPVADDAYLAQPEKLDGRYDGYRVSFETPDTADQDFLIAHKTEETSDTVPSSVDFEFKHQLAKIIFVVDYNTVTNKEDDFYLNSISITNIKKKGTLSTSRFADYADNWSVDNTATMSFSWSWTEGGEGKKISGTDGFTPWQDGLRLIPQTISNRSVSLNIDYRYKVKGGSATEPREVRTSLPAITWQPGLQYTYRLTLHEDNYISFKAIEIQSWGSPQQGGAIIIK